VRKIGEGFGQNAMQSLILWCRFLRQHQSGCELQKHRIIYVDDTYRWQIQWRSR